MFTNEEWEVLQDVVNEAISWEKLESQEDSKERMRILKQIKQIVDKNVKY